MYLNDLNSASHNVDKINKVLANTFGHNVDISEMSTNALERMLTATDAKITQIKESDLTYWENPQYNKLHLISHSLRTYINEVAPVRSTGTVKTKVKEAADLQQAEVLLAAKEMVDKVQKMVEDLAEMQVQELMPIVDAMKEQIGFETAEAFNTAAEAALGAFLDQAKSAKESMENAVLAASGEAPATPMPTDMGMEPDMDADLDMSDDFGAEPAAAGEDNPTGREMKEGIDVMEAQALKEKKFLEAKSRIFTMLEAGQISEEQALELINEFDWSKLNPFKGASADRSNPRSGRVGPNKRPTGSVAVQRPTASNPDATRAVQRMLSTDPDTVDNRREFMAKYKNSPLDNWRNPSAAQDGGIPQGTTTGGPSKLRQRQMAKQGGGSIDRNLLSTPKSDSGKTPSGVPYYDTQLPGEPETFRSSKPSGSTLRPATRGEVAGYKARTAQIPGEPSTFQNSKPSGSRLANKPAPSTGKFYNT